MLTGVGMRKGRGWAEFRWWKGRVGRTKTNSQRSKPRNSRLLVPQGVLGGGVGVGVCSFALNLCVSILHPPYMAPGDTQAGES